MTKCKQIDNCDVEISIDNSWQEAAVYLFAPTLCCKDCVLRMLANFIVEERREMSLNNTSEGLH